MREMTPSLISITQRRQLDLLQDYEITFTLLHSTVRDHKSWFHIFSTEVLVFL